MLKIAGATVATHAVDRDSDILVFTFPVFSGRPDHQRGPPLFPLMPYVKPTFVRIVTFRPGDSSHHSPQWFSRHSFSSFRWIFTIFPSERLILQGFCPDQVTDAAQKDLPPLLQRFLKPIPHTCLLSGFRQIHHRFRLSQHRVLVCLQPLAILTGEIEEQLLRFGIECFQLLAG